MDDREEPTRSKHLTDSQKKWTMAAKIFAILSTIIELTACVGGIVAGAILDSASLIAYGLSSFIGVVATLTVLWRFFGVSPDTPLYEVEAREKKADVGVAFGVFVIATAIVIESTVHLAKRSSPQQAQAVEIICAISIGVYFCLGVCMLTIGYKLESGTMKKDAICAFATCALSAGILISAEIYESNPSVWWFDSALGYVVAAFLYGSGLYTLITEYKYRWWTKQFWITDDFGDSAEKGTPGVEHV